MQGPSVLLCKPSRTTASYWSPPCFSLLYRRGGRTPVCLSAPWKPAAEHDPQPRPARRASSAQGRRPQEGLRRTHWLGACASALPKRARCSTCVRLRTLDASLNAASFRVTRPRLSSVYAPFRSAQCTLLATQLRNISARGSQGRVECSRLQRLAAFSSPRSAAHKQLPPEKCVAATHLDDVKEVGGRHFELLCELYLQPAPGACPAQALQHRLLCKRPKHSPSVREPTRQSCTYGQCDVEGLRQVAKSDMGLSIYLDVAELEPAQPLVVDAQRCLAELIGSLLNARSREQSNELRYYFRARGKWNSTQSSSTMIPHSVPSGMRARRRVRTTRTAAKASASSCDVHSKASSCHQACNQPSSATRNHWTSREKSPRRYGRSAPRTACPPSDPGRRCPQQPRPPRPQQAEAACAS
jgi:hypothetical protein